VSAVGSLGWAARATADDPAPQRVLEREKLEGREGSGTTDLYTRPDEPDFS
jgi:hypothetical protein